MTNRVSPWPTRLRRPGSASRATEPRLASLGPSGLIPVGCAVPALSAWSAVPQAARERALRARRAGGLQCVGRPTTRPASRSLRSLHRATPGGRRSGINGLRPPAAPDFIPFAGMPRLSCHAAPPECPAPLNGLPSPFAKAPPPLRRLLERQNRGMRGGSRSAASYAGRLGN